MPGPAWIADAADQVRRVELDGLTALFHRPSGTTHLLAPPAPQILDAIANNPGDLSQIIERMSEHFELDGAEDALRARLAELEAAGLIRRAAP